MTGPAMSLEARAKAAYAAYLAAHEAALESERESLRQQARAALRAVLVDKDPATGADVQITLTEVGLVLRHTDIDLQAKTGLVVWSTGRTHLGVHLVDGQWRVRLVRQDAGVWVGDRRIRSLADLGQALA